MNRAMQAALIITFIEGLEESKSTIDLVNDPAINDAEEVDRYLEQINSVFVPNNIGKFLNLVMIMQGAVHGSTMDTAVGAQGASSAWEVLFGSQELNTASWVKLRLLLVEIWRPENKHLAKRIREARSDLRSQGFKSLYQRNLRAQAKDLGKAPEDLPTDVKGEIFGRSFEDFKQLVLALSGDKLEAADFSPLANLEEDVEEDVED
jgi:hypothetical protein